MMGVILPSEAGLIRGLKSGLASFSVPDGIKSDPVASVWNVEGQEQVTIGCSSPTLLPSN